MVFSGNNTYVLSRSLAEDGGPEDIFFADQSDPGLPGFSGFSANYGVSVRGGDIVAFDVSGNFAWGSDLPSRFLDVNVLELSSGGDFSAQKFQFPINWLLALRLGKV